MKTFYKKLKEIYIELEENYDNSLLYLEEGVVQSNCDNNIQEHSVIINNIDMIVIISIRVVANETLIVLSRKDDTNYQLYLNIGNLDKQHHGYEEWWLKTAKFKG